ncbi:MAG: hypothetical protein ABEI99_03240 [Halobaculum sp.]
MTRAVRLNELHGVLSEYEFPKDRDALADICSDVTLVLADGQVDLGDTLRGFDTEEFDSADDVESELMNHLPREAVGEPYQSEGDG